MHRKLIRVFEYDEIKAGNSYDDVLFDSNHLEAIQLFNDQHDHKYFRLTHNGVKFREYVGVLQIGDLIIEILPKTDKNINVESDFNEKEKWGRFLLEMLKISGFIKVDSLTKSYLHFRNSNLFDIYVEHFLIEVESLLYKGLTKKYHSIEGNKTVLKGRLVFSKHLIENLIRKERFYTHHQIYDFEHILNQILLEALNILKSTNYRSSFADKINKFSLLFPEIERTKITIKTFDNLRFNRKTERYRTAISLAKLIILNYCPDIKVGTNNVIALLFNMYDLWQVYIYRMLIKDQDKLAYSVKYEYQNKMEYWHSKSFNDKSIRPDFIIKKEDDTYVLDTKWKIINDKGPSDSDLHQMFVYNLHVLSSKSMLLYPDIGNQSSMIKGSYDLPLINEQEDVNGYIKVNHHCQLGFVKPFVIENGQIGPNRNIAKEIIEMLV